MSDLRDSFDKARSELSGERLEAVRQNYFIEAMMRESDDSSIGGVNVNTSGRHQFSGAQAESRKNATQDAIFLSLLDDMRERLAELDASMAERFKTLQGKYGEDVIGGMVDTFLTDEEKAGLDTDEQKIEALVDKFLNEDGSIKDEYKNTEEAKYIRDWQEAQKLRPIVQKYEGRNDLTADEQREVYDTAKTTSLAGNKNMITLSENSEFKTTVNASIDSNRTDVSDVKTSFGFNYS